MKFSTTWFFVFLFYFTIYFLFHKGWGKTFLLARWFNDHVVDWEWIWEGWKLILARKRKPLLLFFSGLRLEKEVECGIEGSLPKRFGIEKGKCSMWTTERVVFRTKKKILSVIEKTIMGRWVIKGMNVQENKGRLPFYKRGGWDNVRDVVFLLEGDR